MRSFLIGFSVLLSVAVLKAQQPGSYIRLNLLGYQPQSSKAAVWCSMHAGSIRFFSLKDATTGKVVYSAAASRTFGSYGPFAQTQRLVFSNFKQPGVYYIEAGDARSPVFTIGNNVYKGAADFCLRYMRQQRSGFNPFLNDSCHQYDGYTLYGPMPDSTHIEVSGGWHDASDYLQYASTTANATYHLLMAYRDFPEVFTDEKLANGLTGKNNIPDILDEARWGLQWLQKMHPADSLMFNQLGDDRDHISMRIPKLDSQYGRGYERPVYFIDGKPQQRGKFLNNTTGTSSTAAKFSSAFALASTIFEKSDTAYSSLLQNKSVTAIIYALQKPGVTQTVSVRSPYIYAEDNWVDDMELAKTWQYTISKKIKKQPGFGSFIQPEKHLTNAFEYAKQEPVTPWLGADTARHYQWYPFINSGHYELTRQLNDTRRDSLINFYRMGIEKVWNKARTNAFYRGVPFIWCSNNLTTSFAIQCYWYKKLSNSNAFEELEQANVDWLFGCNPWGTSFVYGLPQQGDYPQDPHSAFTHLKNYPIDGGLVDGPVYGSIYNNLIGIQLYQPDEYQLFQSNQVVYHDDYGDYSTNEPTMDGTASLIYLLAAMEHNTHKKFVYNHGAIIRGDTAKKEIALVFTGHEFADGAAAITNTLQQHNCKASFFFTGDFYNNPKFKKAVLQLKQSGHYLGAHSDKHLLYASWNNRDSLLINRQQFTTDLQRNYAAMKKLGISKAPYFLPPYEWHNDSIAAWTKQLNLKLVNFTPGTSSNADYTWPQLANYKGSSEIYNSVIDFETNRTLNGFILLLHAGTSPARTDKFYTKLPQLISELKRRGYRFVRIDELLR